MPAKSIEPTVKAWASGQIEKMGWQHGPEQNGRDFDKRVAKAILDAPSKSGEKGAARPDHTIILTDGAEQIPVLAEWKGAKGDLRDSKDIALRGVDGYLRFGSKGIDKYATLGAAYYASKVVENGGYSKAIALAVNGYYKNPTDKEPTYEVAVYAVSKDDPEKFVHVGDYSDLSFMNKSEFQEFRQKIDDALDPVAAKLRKTRKAQSLDAALKHLSEFLFSEHGIAETERVDIVSALVMAIAGVYKDGQWVVRPLTDEELFGGQGRSSDGALTLAKVEDYLEHREPQLPKPKIEAVVNTLRKTLQDPALSRKSKSGMSVIKEAFRIVEGELWQHYNPQKPVDFTGQLFNEMYRWVKPAGDTQNDVVLTPKETTEMMVRLTQIDCNSFVWDWTLGTGAFLVSAMNVMMEDAQRKFEGEALRRKINQIKMDQLLGIEKLGYVYVLAVLNMILMGDGSANIYHMSSLDFDGLYQERPDKGRARFPATTLVLNPPYSAPGNGLIFVKEAFEQMIKAGTGKYGAVLIQDSAGSGKAREIAADILKGSTLISSIKMPAKLFIGKSGVQTSIYLFEVGKPHDKDTLVKFIDFRDDGFERSNRRKVNDPSINLRDVRDAKGRYAEVIAIATGKAPKTNYFPKGEFYFEDTIDPQAANDWNFDQHQKFDTKPKFDDFRKTVADYLAWEVDQLLKRGDIPKVDSQSMTEQLDALAVEHDIDWQEFKLEDLFGKSTRGRRLKSDDRIPGDLPFITAGEAETGISAWIGNDVHVFKPNTITIDMFGSAKYRGYEYGGDDHVAIVHTEELGRRAAQFITAAIHKSSHNAGFDYSRNFYAKDADALNVMLPVNRNGELAIKYMDEFIRTLEAERLRTLEAYLKITGLSDYTLTKRERERVNQFLNNNIVFNDFQVGGLNGLFTIAPTKPFEKAIGGEILTPIVSNASTNNGITSYAQLEPNNPGNIITFSDTTDSVDTVFYQPKPFVGYAHVQAMKPHFDLNYYRAMYFISAFKRSIGTNFNWGRKFNRATASSLYVQIPTKPDGTPDFDFMEDIIRATQKLAIKDVVDWLGLRLEATRQTLG